MHITEFCIHPRPPFFWFLVDDEALKKKITDEMHEGFEQDRTKAEQELQAWLDNLYFRVEIKILKSA